VNIHRHARASLALVRLLQSTAELSVEIADNGVGIPEETLAKIESAGMPGVGLRGARERVKDLNGDFRVASSSSGTTIRIAFPLEQLAQKAAGIGASVVHASAQSG
jgi:signal transduction histidine kinase